MVSMKHWTSRIGKPVSPNRGVALFEDHIQFCTRVTGINRDGSGQDEAAVPRHQDRQVVVKLDLETAKSLARSIDTLVEWHEGEWK